VVISEAQMQYRNTLRVCVCLEQRWNLQDVSKIENNYTILDGNPKDENS
jgi:hypothetical protein